MGNYSINVTDIAGGDTWTVEVLAAPTAATGGTALANGATTAGDLHAAMEKARQAIFNHIVANGQL